MTMIKKCFILFLTVIFILFLFNCNLLYAKTSYKKFALPLLGVSLLAGGGSIYLQKKAKKKFNESETLWQEYLTVPEAQVNDVYEQKYEKYEDKYAEAKTLRTYYLICLGGSALTFVGAVVLWFFVPSSNKNISMGYNTDYTKSYNDLYIKVKF